MASRHQWYWLSAIPLALVTACTGGLVDGSADTVSITVRGEYQKRDLASPGTLGTWPTRYAYAEIRRDSDGSRLAPLDLDISGRGTAAIPWGEDFFVVLYADVVTPSPTGTGFTMYGNVKKAVPQTQYATADALNATPTWYTTSQVFRAEGSGSITLTALESTSEAGAFAIADQMVEFAQGMGRMEPGLPLPDLHTFWMAGTASTYPSSNATATSTGVLLDPGTKRPMLVNEIRYGGPANCADAFNDSLLVETFAHGLFAYGSTWTTDNQGTRFGSLVRGDNDQVYVDPFNASEPTMAFASGFGHFLSAAIRNNPNLYYMADDGAVTSWTLGTHSSNPTGGGEFYGASVARSMWGVWQNALGGSAAGLQTMWNATNPSLANQSLEFGKAPLACFPTYLVGLTRLAAAQGGAAAIRTEMPRENIGGSNGDVTDPWGAYYNTSSALWITRSALPLSLAGTLTHTSSNTLDPYEQSYAQTYLVYNDGNNRTLSLSGSGPGLLVELFDSLGYLAYAKAPGSPSTISLPSTPGNYTVRVRLDPSQTLTGAAAPYTLVIQ